MASASGSAPPSAAAAAAAMAAGDSLRVLSKVTETRPPAPHGAPSVLLDGLSARFFFAFLDEGVPVMTPPTPTDPMGRLAAGNFGVIYQATCTNGATAAIKYTKSSYVRPRDKYSQGYWFDRYSAESHHALMLEEAHVHRKATTLGSRHICRLLGAYEVEVELKALVKRRLDQAGRRPRLALAMEFYPGQNLRHVVSQGHKLPGVLSPELAPPVPRPPRYREFNEVDKRNMFQPIAQALADLHSIGIIHRDIKPDNIVMKAPPKPGECPELAIIDFGLAWDEDRGDARWGRSGIIGDPAYAAPELYEGDGKRYLSKEPGTQSTGTARSNRYGRPIDVYALGVTLYIFLLGFHSTAQEDSILYSDLPYDYAEEFSEVQEARRAPLRFLIPGHDHALRAQSITPFARDLLLRMLEVDPAKRITMAEVLLHPWLDKANTAVLGKLAVELRIAAKAAEAKAGVGEGGAGGWAEAAAAAAAAAAVAAAAQPSAAAAAAATAGGGSAGGVSVMGGGLSSAGGSAGGGGGYASGGGSAGGGSATGAPSSASKSGGPPPPLNLKLWRKKFPGQPVTVFSRLVRSLRPDLPSFILDSAQHAESLLANLKRTNEEQVKGLNLPEDLFQRVMTIFAQESSVHGPLAPSSSASSSASSSGAGEEGAGGMPAAGAGAGRAHLRGLTELEMGKVLRRCKVPEAAVVFLQQRLFELLDKDHDGLVQWKEFVAFLPLLSKGNKMRLFPRSTLVVFWDIWARNDSAAMEEEGGAAGGAAGGGAAGSSAGASAEAHQGGSRQPTSSKTMTLTVLADMLSSMHAIHGSGGVHEGEGGEEAKAAYLRGVDSTAARIFELLDSNHHGRVGFEDFLGALEQGVAGLTPMLQPFVQVTPGLAEAAAGGASAAAAAAAAAGGGEGASASGAAGEGSEGAEAKRSRK